MPMKTKLCDFLNQYEQNIKKESFILRNQSLPPLTEELFSQFEVTGNRLQYESVYFYRRKFLVVYAMAVFLWRKQEDIQKLEEVLYEICDEKCWALPAHVNRVNNKSWDHTVDLFASETAQSLAEISSLLDGDLSVQIKDLVKQQVINRVIVPFFQTKKGSYQWETLENNWSAVCAGSIGSACIYLLNDNVSQLNPYLKRIINVFEHYLNGFTPDGACPEGLGYYTYGMTYFIGFADQLYDYTDGNIDLLLSDKLEQIATFQQKCYFPSGLTVSFSDGNPNEKFRLGLTCYLAEKYKHAAIPDLKSAMTLYDDSCYRWMGIYRDYIWTKNYLEQCSGQKTVPVKCEVLPDAQIAVFKSQNGTGLYAKGGNNGESHNHNDVGSFSYIYDKYVFLEDLGAGEYTKDYFGDKRYDILCNNSLGHNVPVINGQLQKPGSEYRCDNFQADPQGNIFISYGGAYGNSFIKSVVRKISVNPKNGSVEICDSFCGKMNAIQVTENLITSYKPVITGNQIYLDTGSAFCRILVLNYFGKIKVIDKIHTDHSGKPQTVWLIQWDLKVTGECTECEFHLTSGTKL